MGSELLKFTPLYWGFPALLTVPKENDDENKRELREALLRDLSFLRRAEVNGRLVRI
jgi:hypothetical protein